MKIERFGPKARESILLAVGPDAEDDLEVIIWEGSVRSSKTMASLWAWLKFVRSGPAGNLVMIGKTERTLKRNIIDPLVNMLGEKRCRYVAGNGELFVFGRRIYVVGANDEKAQDKIRGLTLAGAYGDEISLWPESMWAMLLTRMSIEGAKVFGTTNPDNPNHWLMRDWLSRACLWLHHDGTLERIDTARGEPTIKLARFSFRLADNQTLPAKFVAALQRQFTGLWRLRFIEGLWVVAEGAIYDTFDPTPGAGHVVAELPRIVRWIVAIDHGTTNPFVAVLIGVGEDDRLYVAREWRWDSKKKRGQRSDAQYSAALRVWLDDLDPEDPDIPSACPGARHPDWIIVDPSATGFIVQLYNDGWHGVAGANNKVADGIRSCSSLLNADRLSMHESCEDGIAEWTGYVWDDKAALKGEEKPVKQADHFPDAVRYGVMALRSLWRNWLAVDDELDEAA